MDGGDRPRSVIMAAEKARAQRMQRVKMMLERKLEQPPPIIDALMVEAGEGEAHNDL